MLVQIFPGGDYNQKTRMSYFFARYSETKLSRLCWFRSFQAAVYNQSEQNDLLIASQALKQNFATYRRIEMPVEIIHGKEDFLLPFKSQAVAFNEVIPKFSPPYFTKSWTYGSSFCV